MVKYLKNGVQLAWLIDPFGQQTLVYRPDRDPESITFDTPLTGEAVLPGFAIRMGDLM